MIYLLGVVCLTPNTLSPDALNPDTLSPCALCTDGLTENVSYSEKIWN